MEELESASVRLSNVRTVEPILGALRTISLGSWHAVLTQQRHIRDYHRRLIHILAALWPALQRVSRGVHILREPASVGDRVVLLAVGSERGLCGRFNASVSELVQEYLDGAQAKGFQVKLAVLGTRLVRLMRRAGRYPVWVRALSATALPPFRVAFELTGEFMTLYNQGTLDAVDVVYNVYQRMGDYRPAVVRLLPPSLPTVAPQVWEEIWPPPIIETDPLGLYGRIAEQYITLHLYELLLESAAAEHMVRYQLMEAALQNANRLIEELTLVVQSARRQAITREMQELAVGAGLLGRQRR